jgi:hypothetical protein
MKAAVITTGPGVIIATAIASTNCRSVSQMILAGSLAQPVPDKPDSKGRVQFSVGLIYYRW